MVKILIFALLQSVAIAIYLALCVLILALTIGSWEKSILLIPAMVFAVAFYFSFIPAVLGGAFLVAVGKDKSQKSFRRISGITGVISALTCLFVFSFFRGTEELGGSLSTQSFIFFLVPLLVSLGAWVYLSEKFLHPKNIY